MSVAEFTLRRDTDDTAMARACQQACDAIAPVWPLDRSIAVNPHWQRIGLPVRTVAARMAVLAGIEVLPPRSRMREAWQSGRITPADLRDALLRSPDAQGLTEADCIQALDQSVDIAPLPLLIDLLDQDPKRHSRLSWRQAIIQQVSQSCAAYFDQHQAEWHPDRSRGLYAFWHEALRNDHGIGLLMGLPRIGRVLSAVPESRAAAEQWALQRLGLPPTVWADYLEAVLLTINGWASWCAYLGWQARLAGGEDQHLRELLAIRLAWGAILLEYQRQTDTGPAFDTLRTAWATAPQRLAEAETRLVVDEVWQSSYEIGFQRDLARQLSAPGGAAGPADAPEVQAAFCIDVRSEPLRRALEAVWPAVQTLGFAGFFGLPIAYTPLATTARRPQLPGLLAPSVEVGDRVRMPTGSSAAAAAAHQQAAQQTRLNRLARVDQWSAGNRWPGASFSFVEAAGLGYLGKLGRWLHPGQQGRPRDDLAGLAARYRMLCRPQVQGMRLDDKIALAAGVLRAMGLDRQLAPLVLLVGHGSQTANNAHAASLDCGACCGQSGEVNARSLAQLLNDPAVRAGLQRMQIHVPATTWFLAALHNTTTDDIEVFDLDLAPATALGRWNRLTPVIAQACDQVRRLRAPSLGLSPRLAVDELRVRLRRRANDGAETRPEWGLAGNAAFLMAPRWRSRGAGLNGRVFLHDYDAAQDQDGSQLELLMTAPMVVAHWINWQYHASTCAPDRLGSGNKLLHNVVGGTLGVFEGNGGDLRIGLSRQSLHDGVRWMHEPLRLTVVIDAPQAAIATVIAKHEKVRQLVDNGWLHLWRFEGVGFQRYQLGSWRTLAFSVP